MEAHTTEEPAKSKAQLRAERRAIQEAQRAAKAERSKQEKGGSKTKNQPATGPVKNTASISKVSEAPIVRKVHGSQVVEEQISENTWLVPESALVPDKVPEPSSRLTDASRKIASRAQEPCRVHLFKHLSEPDRRSCVVSSLGLGRNSPIHPVFLALGVDYDEGRISGSNERCIAFLTACETLIRFHQPKNSSIGPNTKVTVSDANFATSFGSLLQKHVKFLNSCRPLAVTMQNAVQFLNQTLNHLGSIDDWEKSQTELLNAIEDFKRDSIYLAGAEIVDRAISSIRSGECVCTFGYSSLVARVLERAWQNSLDNSSNIPEKPFSVLVVDSRPRFEGRRMLQRLVKAGIPCEYTHIGAFPSLAQKVSLVIVGAHALLNNGFVLARMGTAQVVNIATLVAHVPTLVCAETYKFSEHAHCDAFEYNELRDPDDVWRGPRGTGPDYTIGIPGCGPYGLPDRLGTTVTNLSDWRENPNLRLLHLAYDVLPPELVTAVVTEKGTLPTTSVPVVLRVKQANFVPMSI